MAEPRDRQKIHLMALRKFRAIARLALINQTWLNEALDADPENISRKNYHITRSQKRQHSLISWQCKALLNIPIEYRTEQDKLTIYKGIGDLKFLRRFPENVKVELAAHAIFKCFGPNRTIVKQGHEAKALYFVLQGEVMYTIESYDAFLKESVITSTGRMNPGEGFGEYELMNNVARTHTVVSATYVEFLILPSDDFNVVLKDTVQVMWDFILEAMSEFTYFNDFSEEDKREVCLIGKVRHYERDQTILGDNEGLKSYMHFVLYGRCKLIQHIYVETIPDKKNEIHLNKYKLYTETVDLNHSPDVRESVFSDTIKTMRRSLMLGSGTTVSKRASNAVSAQGAKSIAAEAEDIVTLVGSGKSTGSFILPPNVKPVFMEICTYVEKACFCVGEDLRNRRVIACGNKVTILMIPRYWVISKGNSAEWGRIERFIVSSLPDTRQLYNELIRQRKYRQYKKDLVKSLLKTKQQTNSIQNVPYYVRVKYDFDYV